MTEEQLQVSLSLVKESIGLRSNVRDGFLTAIIKGAHGQLTKEQGISLDMDNSYHLMFLVDFSAWRYKNRDSAESIPRHLQFRLHNLVIKNGGATP